MLWTFLDCLAGFRLVRLIFCFRDFKFRILLDNATWRCHSGLTGLCFWLRVGRKPRMMRLRDVVDILKPAPPLLIHTSIIPNFRFNSILLFQQKHANVFHAFVGLSTQMSSTSHIPPSTWMSTGSGHPGSSRFPLESLSILTVPEIGRIYRQRKYSCDVWWWCLEQSSLKSHEQKILQPIPAPGILVRVSQDYTALWAHAPALLARKNACRRMIADCLVSLTSSFAHVWTKVGIMTHPWFHGFFVSVQDCILPHACMQYMAYALVQWNQHTIWAIQKLLYKQIFIYIYLYSLIFWYMNFQNTHLSDNSVWHPHTRPYI